MPANYFGFHLPDPLPGLRQWGTSPTSVPRPSPLLKSSRLLRYFHLLWCIIRASSVCCRKCSVAGKCNLFYVCLCLYFSMFFIFLSLGSLIHCQLLFCLLHVCLLGALIKINQSIINQSINQSICQSTYRCTARSMWTERRRAKTAELATWRDVLCSVTNQS